MKEKIINYMNKIMRFPERIPYDKSLHYLVGTVITAALVLLQINLVLIFAISLLIGFGAEVYQKYTKSGQYDLKDAVAYVIGSLVVLIAVAGYKY